MFKSMIKISDLVHSSFSERTIVFEIAVSGTGHLNSVLSFTAYTLTISGQIVAFVAQIGCESIGIAALFSTNTSFLWDRILNALVLLRIRIFSLADLREQY